VPGIEWELIMRTTEVLVAGAGPTGLLLAGDLAEAGVEVTLLERRPAERTNLTRAFAVHARTLEELDARGVADELVATGQRMSELRLFGRIRIDLSKLPSRFPYLLVTPQYRTEEVLRRRAEAAGARIEHGVELVSLRQDADGVEVGLRDASGTTSGRRARYLVGTDGVHSTVRSQLGEPFPGKSVVRSVLLADVRLADPPSTALTVDSDHGGFVLLAPFGDGWHRVVAWDRYDQQPDSAPVSLEQVRDLVRRVTGTDYGMYETRWTSRFHSDERQAVRYRVGRVLLAGDAAHVHSPAGGQGMNAGLQDAANLGWRLAAAVRGWSSETVLDGYQDERHPVGRMVLRGSHALLRNLMLQQPMAMAVRNAVVSAALRIGPVVTTVAGAVSGVSVRYPAPRGAHRLVGSRVPDLPLTGAGPGRLYQALRGGRFVAVPGVASGHLDPQALAAQYGWRGPVSCVNPATPPGSALLVRPDGYLARVG
jgi:2-polyprenyl-6-methoxyphenol hydroxylase-like FAD-dependent oxidoreductase